MNKIIPIVIYTVLVMASTVIIKQYINSIVSSTSEPHNNDVEISEVIETPLVVDCSNPFSDKQTRNLQLAYKSGKIALNLPETIQSIILVESQAGDYPHRVGNKGANVGKRAYGVMQIKVVAAQHVFKHFPHIYSKYFEHRNLELKELPEEEIIALLLNNDVANIDIGTHYFKLMYINKNKDWKRAVVAYYEGPAGEMKISDHDAHYYLTKVQTQIKTRIRPNQECLMKDVVIN